MSFPDTCLHIIYVLLFYVLYRTTIQHSVVKTTHTKAGMASFCSKEKHCEIFNSYGNPFLLWFFFLTKHLLNLTWSAEQSHFLSTYCRWVLGLDAGYHCGKNILVIKSINYDCLSMFKKIKTFTFGIFQVNFFWCLFSLHFDRTTEDMKGVNDMQQRAAGRSQTRAPLRACIHPSLYIRCNSCNKVIQTKLWIWRHGSKMY